MLEFLLERAWSSPKSGKIVTEVCKIRAPFEWAEIQRLAAKADRPLRIKVKRRQSAKKNTKRFPSLTRFPRCEV
jgi:hypothetical protein